MRTLCTAAYNTSHAAMTKGTECGNRWATLLMRPSANASQAANTAASTPRPAVKNEGVANKPPTSKAARMALLSQAVDARCSGAAPRVPRHKAAAP